MGISLLIQAIKNYDDLSYVKGKVTDTKIIKRFRYSKFNSRVEDVFILSIEGTNDQFGFAQFTEPYKYLLTSRVIGKTAEIYYDVRKNSAEGSVLFPSEMKIDDVEIVSMEETKRWKRNEAIFFLSFSLLLIILVWVAIKQNKRKRMLLEQNDQALDKSM